MRPSSILKHGGGGEGDTQRLGMTGHMIMTSTGHVGQKRVFCVRLVSKNGFLKRRILIQVLNDE